MKAKIVSYNEVAQKKRSKNLEHGVIILIIVSREVKLFRRSEIASWGMC